MALYSRIAQFFLSIRFKLLETNFDINAVGTFKTHNMLAWYKATIYNYWQITNHT